MLSKKIVSTSTSKSSPKTLTLAFVVLKNRILLGMKKRGFGAGRWNGFGGKVLAGETIEVAAQRELLEETGITAEKLRQRGMLTFHFENDPVTLCVHLFSTSNFSGEPHETEEMKPQWFPLTAIPYAVMWANDRYWLPIVLSGKNVAGEFWFKDTDTLLKHRVAVV